MLPAASQPNELIRAPSIAHRCQHNVGSAHAWRLIAGRHDCVEPCECAELLPAEGGIRQDLAKYPDKQTGIVVNALPHADTYYGGYGNYRDYYGKGYGGYY